VDILLSRQEIRRLCRATVGDSTDELQSSQQTVQVNALIDQAALKTQSQCRWLQLQRRASIGVDIGQSVISYAAIEQAYWLEQHYPSQYLPLTYGTAADSFAPADLATADLKYINAGNIIELAIWDPDSRRYVRLPKRIITVDQDYTERDDKSPQEQRLLSIAAGDTAAETNAIVTSEREMAEAQRGIPCSAQCRADGIHLDRPNEIRRVIRVAYVITAAWGFHQQVLSPQQIDQIQSCVDAMAIQYRVISDMYAQQGDEFQSRRYCDDTGYTVSRQKGTGMFWDRIRELRGDQNSGERIAIDDTCRFDEDRDLPDRVIPSWDNRAQLRSTARYLGSN
jgi:hypothetical protein